MLKWDIWEWFCGIGYQELTKTSYFGDSDLYEGCMVVKSGGSNRQFNLLQNEYHIELITYFRFKNWTNSDLSMNICDASLNFQWATSMNIQWISIVKLFVPLNILFNEQLFVFIESSVNTSLVFQKLQKWMFTNSIWYSFWSSWTHLAHASRLVCVQIKYTPKSYIIRYFGHFLIANTLLIIWSCVCWESFSFPWKLYV